MHTLPHSVSALALLTIDLMGQYPPESPPSGAIDYKTVAGFGVLIHWLRDDGSLAFRLETGVTGRHTKGREMLHQLEDALTGVGVLAAYDLYGCALTIIAHVAEMDNYTGLTALGSAAAEQLCDLSEATGPNESGSFEATAGNAGIATVPAAVVAELQWYGPLFEEHATAVLGQQAIATWRLWLHRHVEQNGNATWADAARAQLERWLATKPLPLLDRHGEPMLVATVTAASTAADPGMD